MKENAAFKHLYNEEVASESRQEGFTVSAAAARKLASLGLPLYFCTTYLGE